jgi:hypothetical protein
MQWVKIKLKKLERIGLKIIQNLWKIILAIIVLLFQILHTGTEFRRRTNPIQLTIDIFRNRNATQKRNERGEGNGTKKEKQNLFSWDEIPGSEDGELIEFLIWKYNIDWVETAKIEKSGDGRTIKLSVGKYLFSWDEIPGNDNVELIDFLMWKYNIDWVETAKIEKSDDGRTIKVSVEENYLSLNLNNEKTKVQLKIDDGRTDELITMTENGKLNIYVEKNYLSLNLNNEKTKAHLKIDDGRTDELITMTENGKLNIYT